ncbi:MAG: WYL domain-containing protein [Bacteroidetes bacterium]|nr:WYL domain-containing protein [Bacteroidota bacterium]
MASSARTPTGPQLWRLQQLLQWLRSGRPLTTRRAAERFEVSRRTIYSDIEYLRQIGVPITYDQEQHTYVLEGDFANLPLVALEQTDLAAFLVARFALEAWGDTRHAGLLQSVTERLARHLPEEIHVEPDALTRMIRFDPGPQPHVPLRHVGLLEQAVRDQRVVRMRYFANHRGEATERCAEPYSILSYQGRWYVLAYCRLREGMRDFRIDRIEEASLEKEVFAIPSDFDLDDYLGPAFGMHRGDRTYAVHVRFSAYQARWIAEERWHETQVMSRRPDGTLDVRMQVTGVGDVARWVLSYGGEAEVISPPVLRHRIAREARRMAALYEGDTTLSRGTNSTMDSD